jgi:type I restriction-modification system DNA methylase subunit
VILPHGVLFRGGAEATIRREVVKRGYIKGIIGLPPNLFYGTGIPACILVLDKKGAAGRKGIFMIDASKDFIKDGNKNPTLLWKGKDIFGMPAPNLRMTCPVDASTRAEFRPQT